MYVRTCFWVDVSFYIACNHTRVFGMEFAMKDPLNITTESDILLKLDKKIIKMYKVDVKLPGNMI